MKLSACFVGIVVVCSLMLDAAGPRSSQKLPPPGQATDAKDETGRIEARVLLDRCPAGVTPPPSAIRLLAWRGDEVVGLGGTMEMDRAGIFFKTPYGYVKKGLSVQTEDFHVKEPKPRDYVCFFTPFTPRAVPVSAATTPEPIVVGSVQVVELDEVKLDVSRKAVIHARWQGVREAKTYVVWLSVVAGDRGPRIPVLLLTTSKPSFQIPRTGLARMIARRERERLELSRTRGGAAKGLRRVRYDLTAEVRGIGPSGGGVYAARSGKTPCTFSGKAELAPWQAGRSR